MSKMSNELVAAPEETKQTFYPKQARSLSVSEIQMIADAFYKSGMFRDIGTAAKAFAKILAGQELGIGPMASMSQLHVIEGKVVLDASLVGAKVKQSGRYDYRIRVSDEKNCVIEFFEGSESLGDSSFTIEEADQAKLTGKEVWRKYPKAMLRSRAMTQGARMYCPDVFNGSIYTAEELDFQHGSKQEPPINLAKEVRRLNDITHAPSIISLRKKALNIGIIAEAGDFRDWVKHHVPGCEEIPSGRNPTLEQCLAIDEEINRFTASEQEAA